MQGQTGTNAAGASAALERVLDVVRALALESGGSRAERAVSADASLEREVGLGSLERVELLARLEAAFGRRLEDDALQVDTCRELARAIESADALPSAGAGGLAPAAPALRAPARLQRPPETIHEALWRRAERESSRPHVYLREEDGSETTVAYGRLLEEARAVAGGLRERGVARGAAVALMLPTGLDFLRTFQGILIAGAIPVPIYPPVRLDRLEEYALRQAAILRDAGVVLLVTIPRAVPVAGLLRSSVPGLADVVTADDLASRGATWIEPEGEGSDPAFIQYTSGSTGQPKGVLLSHANLIANIRAIGAGVAVQPTDVGASWLPLYHDMGLIGSWLFCLYEGLPIDIQSPLSFLTRPERWLWAIHRRRATLSAAPNFAYELCARRIPDAALEGLDLSSWRCALNGAEPVNPETLHRFEHRFGPYGFRREAMLPVYGLAECSVALCFPPVGRGPRVDRVDRRAFESEGLARAASGDDANPLRFVSVGAALPEHEVVILDQTGNEKGERVVGRLAFRGPSMTAGYFHKPEATAAIRLAGGFLDSGDLAYRADGEIFVTGRHKDLIIKGGRNFVPQEIEEVAASVEGVRKGCVVAFGVDQETLGTESLVIVAETRIVDRQARDRLAAAITDRVASLLGVPPDQVELVPPGCVPKTSSGKIRRAATRELHREGTLGRGPRTSRLTRARLVAGALLAELRARARRVPRALYAGYLLLMLAPPLLAAWALAALVPSRRLAELVERVVFSAGLRVAGFRLRVSGALHLRGAGPLVIASNHASYVDIPALRAMIPRHFLFVAKREVLDYPLIGAFVRRVGHVTVDRWDYRQGALDSGRVAEALRAGNTVLVFPEGTFTPSVGLRPFRLGAFNAAVESGVPVVPVALRGTRRVLRDGALLPRPGLIELWIGEPIAPEGEGFRAVMSLRDRVADAIAARCGEPRLDLAVAGPERSSDHSRGRREDPSE